RISGTSIQSGMHDGGAVIWNSHSPYSPGSPPDYTFVAAGTSGYVTFSTTDGMGVIHVDDFTLQEISPEDTIEIREGKGYGLYYKTQERVAEVQPPHQSAPFWEYDPRVALRWNTGQEYKQFPSESPYVVN